MYSIIIGLITTIQNEMKIDHQKNHQKTQNQTQKRKKSNQKGHLQTLKENVIAVTKEDTNHQCVG
jgi:uncharacterized membrane protein (DUF106 family)